MRVLITADTIGGVWNYAVTLTEGLLAAGCSVCLVAFGREPNSDQEAFVHSAKATFPSSFEFCSMVYPLEWMPGEAHIAESTLALGKVIKGFRPDLLHLNQYCYGSIESDLPKVVVAHSDVVSWWYACRGVPPPSDMWHDSYHAIVSDSLASADRVIAPTSWQMQQLKIHYGYCGSSGTVIHNGSNRSQATGERHMQAVTAGRVWDGAKNIEMLELMRSDIPIYVAGANHLDGRGTQVAKVTSSVRKLGQLCHSDLQELFARSAIYIAPSLYEPFGLAPLEAAQQGCALVLSDLPTFRELWQEDALYFSPQHPLELEITVRRLVSDPSLLREMALKAQRRARDLYSRDAFVAKYLSLYEELLEVGVENAA